MKKKSKSYFLFFLILLFINSFVMSNVLKGRLKKFGTYGILPASFVNVTLSKKSGQNLKTELTGSDGMYYFHNVEPGSYLLKIWVKDIYSKPIIHKVEVLDKPITQAPPILTHFLKFENPEENRRFPLAFVANIRSKGIHYNLPANAMVWIILKCRNDNFLINTKRHIYIEENGKWESDNIPLDRPIKEIIAILVTKTYNAHLRLIMSSKSWDEFSQLPLPKLKKDSYYYILATRKIIVD